VIKIRYLVGFIALVYGGILAFRAWERQNDGFYIANIEAPKGSKPPIIQVALLPHDLQCANAILEQEFFYLGRGFQCYAFESKDKQYVLKFFRYQRLQLPFVYDWVGRLPPFAKAREKRIRELERRKMHIFRGFALAFKEAKEETALIYVHLAKTMNKHPAITIVDKAKNRYRVNLDDVEFLIQRRAQHIKPVFDSLMLEGKVDEAKRRIDQIFDLLYTCAKRGIQDTDKSLIRKNNLGFLPERAIYIDTGKLALREKIKTKEGFTEDLQRLIPLYEWFMQHHPELAGYFKIKQDRVLREFCAISVVL
jgi:hypothetical protein